MLQAVVCAGGVAVFKFNLRDAAPLSKHRSC